MKIYLLALLAAFAFQSAGAEPVLEILAGTPTPHLYQGRFDCKAPNFGRVLATLSLVAGKSFWQDTRADASGVAGHFRMYDGSACLKQGKVTESVDGNGIRFDTTSIAAGQTVTVVFGN